MPIKALFDKIKWDPHEEASSYHVYYEDRMSHALVCFSFSDIIDREDGFLKIKSGKEAVIVPLHRIKKVEKHGRIVWERQL